MGKMKDLTGCTFGMLYVIERAEDIKPGRPAWRCECDCGNITTVSSTALLKSNGTKSCGCLRNRPSDAVIDLTGQTFGKLSVMCRANSSTSGKAKWVCQCKCGSIVSVLSEKLRQGKTKSCGCNVRQLKYDLTGQKFGFLHVIEPIVNPYVKSNETRWKCRCENCGRIVQVSSYSLRHSDPYGHCKCTRFNKLQSK